MRVFDAFTDGDYSFSKTHIKVRLFEHGDLLLSRSEARRIVNGLEKFKVVVLDFAGVDMVGQGFCDEIFRVWKNRHAEISLAPVNMTDNVEFMVKRSSENE